jgi:hypothetical protein
LSQEGIRNTVCPQRKAKAHLRQEMARLFWETVKEVRLKVKSAVGRNYRGSKSTVRGTVRA